MHLAHRFVESRLPKVSLAVKNAFVKREFSGEYLLPILKSLKEVQIVIIIFILTLT